MTDIYTNRKGIDFVKTADGKGLLPVDGIKDCAPSIDCSELGYKKDWWNYSITPNFDNSDEYFEYEQSVRFAEKQLAIKNAIERAKTSSSVRQSPQKMNVLSEAEYLHSEAEYEFARFRDTSSADSLQYGAATLASTIVDIGISVSPLGWGKDAYELITGTNLVTGEKLSDSERIMAGIGVVMPGVAGLAFAGIRIAARTPVAKNAINGALTQVGNVSDLLGNMKIARFKEGKSFSEVAVIGRDMGSVREARARLNAAGIKTRVFEPSKTAIDSMKEAVKRNEDKYLLYGEIPETAIYKENMDWVQKLKDDQVSVIDIGNPKGINERSRFYDDEVLNIFGKVNKL
ncbi:pre-toxin TG domain-containing protein [Bdellovibrio sp. HCB-110]|uniref:pre-toxin TG domain-containing protein n=1 Tax=Bdellovibrio sp. HCB-110 TaxID=3391182 RepID=UPI0039B62008